MEKASSPALVLMRLISSNSPYGGYPWSPHYSRQQYDGALQDALRLAITAGLHFDSDDMKHIRQHYPLTWHIGNNDNWGEEYYSLAVRTGNTSAARSFEKMKGRKPFIWADGVTHLGRDRKRDRLSVGDIFRHEGRYWTVTSFDDDAGQFVACCYRPAIPRKIEQRRRFTHKEMYAARNEPVRQRDK